MKKQRDLAAALRYDPEEQNAPVVVAAGRGELAAKIKEIAREHGVPLYRDEALAAALIRLGVQVEIPPEFYQAVAHILVYVAGLDRKMGQAGTTE